MFRHVLLTTDFSEEARRAYAPAVELARALGARITLLHVVPTLTDVPVGTMAAMPISVGDPEADMTSARQALEDEREQLDADLDVRLDVVTSAKVVDGVIAAAKRHGADLILLSTHGRSGLRRMLMGSMAEGVLRGAHVPVLCIPPPAE